MKTKPVKPYQRKFGAGDFVAALAKPIVVVSDAVLGTDLANCPGCQERKEKLNEAVPNVNPLSHG